MKKNRYYLPDLSIRTDYLQSCSVERDEVCATVLRRGETLYCRGRAYTPTHDVVVMVDRLRQHDNDGSWSCTMIRQALPVSAPNAWAQRWTDPERRLRRAARRNGLRLVTVPGGIPPLTPPDMVAVPDYNISGTKWYLMPDRLVTACGCEIYGR